MATLRKDSFAQQFPARFRGISDNRLRHRLSGIPWPHITMNPPKTIFTAPLDDVYGPHCAVGEAAKDAIAREKANEELRKHLINFKLLTETSQPDQESTTTAE